MRAIFPAFFLPLIVAAAVAAACEPPDDGELAVRPRPDPDPWKRPPAACRPEPLPDPDPRPGAPAIHLRGPAVVELPAGAAAFVDPGATADDAEDGDLSAALRVTGADRVDTGRAGDHVVSYEVTDIAGLSAPPALRVVRVRGDGARPRLSPRTFDQTHAPLEYLEHLPVDYGAGAGEDAGYPLLVYFHGWGHSKDLGDGTLAMLDEVSMVQVLRGDRWDEARPFVVLVPQQCWEGVDPPDIALAHAFVRWAVHAYRVDQRRIYVAGLSAGGWAVWEYMRRYPREVAAAVPMAAGGIADQACTFKDVPTWGFHAADDNVVPVTDMIRTVLSARACSPPPAEPPRMTIYPGGGHVIDDETLDLSALGTGLPSHDLYDRDIYQWLLQHHL